MRYEKDNRQFEMAGLRFAALDGAWLPEALLRRRGDAFEFRASIALGNNPVFTTSGYGDTAEDAMVDWADKVYVWFGLEEPE